MNNLKLNKLNRISDELKNAVKGGEDPKPEYCTCGCCYANHGGSSFDDNKTANFNGCLHTKCDEFVEVPEM